MFLSWEEFHRKLGKPEPARPCDLQFEVTPTRVLHHHGNTPLFMRCDLAEVERYLGAVHDNLRLLKAKSCGVKLCEDRIK